MEMKDLKRVRAGEAKMTFVLADFTATEPNAEDKENIIRAAAM